MTSQDARQAIYEPLGASSIRLLSIKPAFPTEIIECAFVTVANLAEAPSYDALSYVWGEELNADSILCNGVSVTVTRQLADALKHLRRPRGRDSVVSWLEDHPLHSTKNAWNGFAKNRHEESRCDVREEVLLWADALCINQADTDERASQVKMMGKIYARAENVKIWLGKEDRRPLNFVDLRSTVGGIHIGTYGRVPISLSFIAQALRNARQPRNKIAAKRPMEDSSHRNVSYGFPPPDAPEWDVVRNFFANAWFERVWVVQEAVLASRATALIGDWEIDWAAIGQAAVWFQSKGYAVPAVVRYQLRDQQDLLPVSKAASAWKLCSWSDNRIPLLDLLDEFRTRQAKNAMDKVYATFGMAEELADMEESGYDELVEPNYATKSILDVYRDIAIFLIIKHENLEILSHAGTSALSHWPSWVPDWRHEKTSNALSTTSVGKAYNANGDRPVSFSFSSSANAITLQGTEEDSVAAYGDRLASYGFGYVTYQEEIDFVRMAWELCIGRLSTISSAGTKDDIARAFVRTLTAGLSNANTLASEDPGFDADALQWFTQHAPHMLPVASFIQRLRWSMKQRPDPGRFHEAFVRACVDRRFFITKRGLMGIGPDTMKEGDAVVVLYSGRVPYLLRPIGSSYNFLGECYMPGLMDDEAVRDWEERRSEPGFFELV